jgi:pimeloyl-ACP methyl ester carboxylesterase
MPTARLAGFSIAYETYGNPVDSPVFLVHGLYHDHLSMATLAERLSDTYFVIAHDAIGHGRSEKADRFSLYDQGRVLNELIKHLGYTAAFVIGESMGAYIAAQAAILEPARIAKLILLAAKSHGPSSSIVAYLAQRGINPDHLTTEEVLAALAPVLWSPETLAERRADIVADMLPDIELTRSQMAAVDGSLVDFDLRPELPRIKAATLIIAGRSDGLNPPELAREMVALIPRARLELFQHSGHLLKWEEQVKLGDVVREFFALKSR